MKSVRIAHLSDLHQQLDWGARSWGSSGWRGVPGRFELHGLGRLARFEGVEPRIAQLVDDLHALDVDHAVLTGDVSALGHEDEVGRVHELLEPLVRAGRLTVIPGNHDRYTDRPGARVFERFFTPRSDWPEYAGPDGYPFVRLVNERLAVVGLDSTRVPGWTHYLVGRVGEAQLDALGRLLSDPRLAGRTVLVLSHHGPLGPSGRFHWNHSALLDAGALTRRVRQHHAVLLHGHSHQRYWHRRTEARPHVLSAGSATEPGGEGYWLLELEDAVTMEARRYLPGRRADDPVRRGHSRPG